MSRKLWVWAVGMLVIAGMLASAAGASTRVDNSRKLTKVTLQLKWVTQAQFAGYYAAKAMIGTALAAIAYGMSARPRRCQRASTMAVTIPSPQPIAQPPSASWNVNQPPWRSSLLLVQKFPAIAVGCGARKRLM